MKQVLIVAAALAALAMLPGIARGATTTHSTAAKRARPTKLGLVPGFIRTGRRPGEGIKVVKGALRAVNTADGPVAGDNLTYNGPDQIPPASLKTLPRVMEGPVHVYTIFWQPVGYRTAPNYQDTVNQFFSDVSAASMSGDSPYDTTGQYFDDNYGISDVINMEQTTQDYTPFPRSGCKTPTNLGISHFTVVGASVCLSDAQIQAEVKKVADANGWPHGPNVQFFMYTPHNVESCSGSDCAYSTYCAYHWFFGTTPSTEYIYANMPFPNQSFTADGSQYATDCDSGEHPNGDGGQTTGSEPGYPSNADAADEVINVSSHENNEAITDPTGLGWWVDKNTTDGTAQMENGDLCAWYWPSDTGSVLGGKSHGALYTNSFNGDMFFIQGEWSNIDATSDGNSGCLWGHSIPSLDENSGPSITETSAVVGTTLHGSIGDWTGLDSAVITYAWLRCNGNEFAAARRSARAHNFAGASGCVTKTFRETGLADGGGEGDFSNNYVAAASDVGDYMVFCVGVQFGENQNGDCTWDSAPKVSGEPELNTDSYGSVPSWLTESAGTFQPGSVVTLSVPHDGYVGGATAYTVQWKRCYSTFPCSDTGKPVKVNAKATGPTTTSYTVQPTDVGQFIRAYITATNHGGASDGRLTSGTDTAFGNPTDGIGSTHWSNTSPVIGTPDLLSIGSWSAPTAAAITGFTVTLYRCPTAMPIITSCEAITTLPQKATANNTTISYMPVAADAGWYLTAMVTASSKWTVSAYASSIAFAVAGGAPVGGVPTLTGASPTLIADPLLDQGFADWTLDMSVGSWSGSPTQFRFTVYNCSDPSDTTTCLNDNGVSGGASGRQNLVNGVAKAHYFPGVTDVGRYLRYSVQAISPNGAFSTPVWSAPDVGAFPSNITGPTVTADGDAKGYDIDPGAWSDSPVAYVNLIYVCSDDTEPDSCNVVDEADSTDVSEYIPTTAFGSGFVRVQTYAINDSGMSTASLSDAVAIQPPPPS